MAKFPKANISYQDGRVQVVTIRPIDQIKAERTAGVNAKMLTESPIEATYRQYWIASGGDPVTSSFDDWLEHYVEAIEVVDDDPKDTETSPPPSLTSASTPTPSS